MSDVLLYQTDDGGEIDVIGGRVVLDDSPATGAYLSLFGGNLEDDGSTATEPKQWWGNLLEQDRARRYRSETQALLRALPAIPANLRRIEDAAARDLAWMTEELGAVIEAAASIPGPNRIVLAITIAIDATTTELKFVQPWGIE